ncbi:MAG: hypothetical protein ACRELB_13385, partial [Polyangiaceae bacterium]
GDINVRRAEAEKNALAAAPGGQARADGNPLAGLDARLVGHVGATGFGKPIFQNVMPKGKTAGLIYAAKSDGGAHANGNGSNGNGHGRAKTNGNGKLKPLAVIEEPKNGRNGDGGCGC